MKGVIRAAGKKEREEQDAFFGEGSLKKKGKRPKQSNTNTQSDQLDYATFTKFSKVKIDPPNSVDQYEDKIKDLD